MTVAVKHFDDEIDLTGLCDDEIARSIQVCIVGQRMNAVEWAAGWLSESGRLNCEITNHVSIVPESSLASVRVTLTDFGLPTGPQGTTKKATCHPEKPEYCGGYCEDCFGG